MATEVKIPAMGESITSGILASWRVSDGDTVKKDQPLYELETDKITSEGVAEIDGVIRITVEAGTEVGIGQVVATIDPAATVSKPATAPDAASDKAEAPHTTATPASPAVRRIAEETGVDPAAVPGSGKGGRVTKGDMLQAVENFKKSSASPAPAKPAPETPPAKTPPVPPAAAPQTASAGSRTTRKRMTPLRAKIAQRLVQVKNETAMLTTFNEVDMSAVRDLRTRYQDDFVKRYGVKLGFMSLFVKAAVHALKEVPGINAVIDGDDIVQNHYYDVGVAVSTERGLMVPVVRDCDRKHFAEIENDIAAYAKKARDGKVTLDDLAGGVFTITNGGIFGSLLSTPIINPPQSAILGMHAIQDRPVAVDGQVVIRPMMYLALSYDHRIVDGREAVTFLVKMKQVLEDPARLLIGV
ncbi:2-oxoglutarate dehydrogenase complex dihydrolipoyllysine-residue succinyltransferase [Opitutales bacterium ASA1]|uniref:2-oxoglutarate dehydrogenase complex dihydrolipoyllysine-residue succinyltransferase n=1 Tax=Congregicoccus parvus TaxID=3081749 RepID=UPI002B2A341D|nr:2-oxoglutarate dehydrogenase complex dihydrolipoyllysine-residue succinyltransferase [Opitutales bacterium ASA1]